MNVVLSIKRSLRGYLKDLYCFEKTHLLYLPDIIGLQELSEVVVLLHA